MVRKKVSNKSKIDTELKSKILNCIKNNDVLSDNIENVKSCKLLFDECDDLIKGVRVNIAICDNEKIIVFHDGSNIRYCEFFDDWKPNPNKMIFTFQNHPLLK